MTREILIGCAAGFAGDRYDAGPPLVRAMAADGRPAYLMYETLGERTLALAQQRQRSGAPGYLPEIDGFLAPVLADCLRVRIPIVGNFGAADPRGAARRVAQLAERDRLTARVAAVLGDDLRETLSDAEICALAAESGESIDPSRLVAANVYLGAGAIAEALDGDADVVVTGRVSDPSLAIGPLLHAFRWLAHDWDRLACGTVAGHLLECGAQVTGGYYMDPGAKEIPLPEDIGYPIAEVDANGRLVIGKPAGTGGLVSLSTVREQLLYEIHDPSAYLTPDVVLDLTEVVLQPLGADRVRVAGARGKPRPETLKATICYDGGWLGEGEISYAGPNAEARGRLAIDIVRKRVARLGRVKMQFDLIGVSSVFNDSAATHLNAAGQGSAARDVRVRAAFSAHDVDIVRRAVREVEGLYTAGPAAGGGVRTSVTPLLASTSAYVPRSSVRPRVEFA